MTQRAIIVLTTCEDLHTAAVAKRLRAASVTPVILERETYGEHWVLTGRQGARDTEIVLDTGSRSYALPDMGAIWLRRDFTVETTKRDTSPEALYVATQSAIHVNGIIALLAERVPTMNRPEANRRCASKFLQADVARRYGLRLPESFQGGSPDIADAFQAAVSPDRQLCIKPLEAIHLRKLDGTTMAHYTSIFRRRNRAELDSLRECPVILQEFIEKDVEIRATVVGNRIFAASIDTKAASPEAQVDWRHYDWANTPYYRHELPTTVYESLLGIMRALGLSYGAIDLIKARTGEYYFLEVNSQGQWLWVEDLTDLKITDAVADWLATAAASN